MRWTLGREPVGNREDAAGLGQRCRLRTREPDDRDLAEALDRLHVAALHRGWVPGPGRQHNCLYAQGNRARRLDSQEAVADRAKARAGGDDDRQRELAGEVSDEVVLGEGNEQAAPSLDNESFGLGRLRLRRDYQRLGIDLFTG